MIYFPAPLAAALAVGLDFTRETRAEEMCVTFPSSDVKVSLQVTVLTTLNTAFEVEATPSAWVKEHES